jgi:SAM-dependent methyltransferase
LVEGLVDKLKTPIGLSLNIGCKETSLGDIGLDIGGRPDVKGSALALPFRTGSFSLAIFTEVLEHLPKGKELQALREISRVLKPEGALILSTPTSEGVWGKLYWLADPAFWLINHRHYPEATIKRFVKGSGFSIELFTLRGGPRDLLFSLVTPLAYALKKLGLSCNPDVRSDYSVNAFSKGYTFIVQARKLSSA